MLQAVLASYGLLGGMSMMLAVARDLLTAMTLHLNFFYVYASFFYATLLRALLALSRLFRGKR